MSGDGSLSYTNLDGDWADYYQVARNFARKVRPEDRKDFLHDLMLQMAIVKVKYKALGKPLAKPGLVRIASYEVMDYWRKEKLRPRGIFVDCGECPKWQRHECRDNDLYHRCRKAKFFISLGRKEGEEEDGTPVELIDVLADDHAIDMDAWLDAKTWLQGCPRRLIRIAWKRANWIPLKEKDQAYLRCLRLKNGIKVGYRRWPYIRKVRRLLKSGVSPLA